MFQVASCREKKPDLVSWLLMKVLKSDYSHVLIIQDGITVWHQVGTGFASEPLEEILKTHDLPDVITVKCPDEAMARGYIKRMVGTPYSESQYLGFIFPFLKRFFRNRHMRAICSEVVADFLKDCCGCVIVEDTDYIDPVQAIAYARTVEVKDGK